MQALKCFIAETVLEILRTEIKKNIEMFDEHKWKSMVDNKFLFSRKAQHAR